MDQLSYADLGFSGPPFSWCNNRQGLGRVWARIDRALGNHPWVLLYPDCLVRHLPRTGSDHSPLLTSLTRPHYIGKKLFRFEHFWFDYDEVTSIVANSWTPYSYPNSLSNFHRNLTVIRCNVSLWNRHSLGKLENRIDCVRDRNHILEAKDCECSLSPEDSVNLSIAYKEHQALLRQLDTKWRSKSRINWVNDGDRNTRFFHLTALLRCRRNSIDSVINENGIKVDSYDQISNAFINFYSDLWSHPSSINTAQF